MFMNMEPSLPLPLVEHNVNPRVWADGKSVGRAQNAIPVVVKLKDPLLFPHKKQYPLKPEVKKGLKPIIENLKEQGKWRLVQDLRMINEVAVPLHPWGLILILYCLKFLNEPNISQ